VEWHAGGSPTPLLIIRLSHQYNSEAKWHRRRPSMYRSARSWQERHESVRRRRSWRRRRILGFQIGSCEQCHTSPRELASRLRLESMQACRMTVAVTSVASANPPNRLLPTSGLAKNIKKARTLANIWTLPSTTRSVSSSFVLQGNKVIVMVNPVFQFIDPNQPYCMWSWFMRSCVRGVPSPRIALTNYTNSVILAIYHHMFEGLTTNSLTVCSLK